MKFASVSPSRTSILSLPLLCSFTRLAQLEKKTLFGVPAELSEAKIKRVWAGPRASPRATPARRQQLPCRIESASVLLPSPSLSGDGGVVVLGKLFERFVAVLVVLDPSIGHHCDALAPVFILLGREFGDLVLRRRCDRGTRPRRGAC